MIVEAGLAPSIALFVSLGIDGDRGPRRSRVSLLFGWSAGHADNPQVGRDFEGIDPGAFLVELELVLIVLCQRRVLSRLGAQAAADHQRFHLGAGTRRKPLARNSYVGAFIGHQMAKHSDQNALLRYR